MNGALREIKILSARLELNVLSVEDAQWLHELHRIPEVLEYLDFPAWTEISQAIDYCLENESHAIARGYAFWAVMSGDNQSPIGISGVRHNPESGNPELIYRFFPQYWGKGYATEAAVAVLGHVFLKTGLTAVFARAQRANLASVRVLEKCGFKNEQSTGDITGNQITFAISKLGFQKRF